MKSTTKIRKQRFLNYSEIARLTGYTPQYVHMLLNGERNNQDALAKVQSVIRETIAQAA